MSELKITLENAKKAYSNGNDNVKKLFEELWGKDKFVAKSDDICERIKIEEDVFAELGESYDEFRRRHADLTSRKYAGELLEKITQAYNQGWWPKFIKGEKRWFPYFNTGSGFLFSYSFCNSGDDCTSVGAALVFENEKKANAAGRTFQHVYKEYMTGKK